MTGAPREERSTFPGKKALNQHLHRHHPGVQLQGDLQRRLEQHDDLHWRARKGGYEQDALGHTHLPYQDGETDNEMAQRLLDEGTAAQNPSE